MLRRRLWILQELRPSRSVNVKKFSMHAAAIILYLCHRKDNIDREKFEESPAYIVVADTMWCAEPWNRCVPSKSVTSFTILIQTNITTGSLYKKRIPVDLKLKNVKPSRFPVVVIARPDDALLHSQNYLFSIRYQILRSTLHERNKPVSNVQSTLKL